ncbi:MAG: mechanosensitive ion channel family protein, partial [Gammaproteobacteria bacterium]|nr:mechanosensitive ion channel family protein [Gammaproteobacteria bacterium]
AGEGGTASLLETPEQETGDSQFTPIRTDSPRLTLTTFLQLRDDLEKTLLAVASKGRIRADHERLLLLGDQFRALLNLSSVPSASRREIGSETMAFLLDILGRIELPNLDDVPDVDAFADDAGPAVWRIPQTPIRIVRIAEGPRQGEFLFSERTIRAARRFYRGIESLPLRSSLGIKSWSRTIPQLTGPMIPLGVSTAMPDGLKRLWLNTPIWKVLAVLILAVLLVSVIKLFHRVINRGETNNQTGLLLRRALTPLAILVVVRIFESIIAFEINVSGAFSTIVDRATTVVTYVAAVWLFWLVVLLIFERVIVLRELPEESFDTQFLRIGGRALGIVGGVIIIGIGAQELGLPVYSIVAGLGIGGLAVALAIRPTLENLIGGVMLYLDQPVRVGDFCTFGDKMGTIESIGVRSTKLRALDRTMITVPNAALADMQLINWAKCDRMLITTTIGLRYETDPDQLRYVLVKFREMLHAHPKIDPETVRVRFAGYGVSSLDIGVRVYALTHEWNEFHAIREDIYLRMNDIVRKSGSSFAFPSQTLYMGRDGGLDSELGEAAIEEVQSWRRAGELPFPGLSTEKIEQLEGTLDYPPQGSVQIGRSEKEVQEAPEPLSAGRDTEDADEPKRPLDRGDR